MCFSFSQLTPSQKVAHTSMFTFKVIFKKYPGLPSDSFQNSVREGYTLLPSWSYHNCSKNESRQLERISFLYQHANSPGQNIKGKNYIEKDVLYLFYHNILFKT